MKEIHFFSNHWKQIDWDDKHKYLLPKNYDGAESIFCESGDYDTMEDILSDRRENPRVNDYILTTQMCFLSTDWIEMGYKIFVHDITGDYEVRLGEDNERTHRYIRMGHNLFKMWHNGEFAI